MDTSNLVTAGEFKDLFIFHADAELDTRFVRQYLLPSLKLPPDRLVLSSSLPPGRLVLHAVEQALASCRITVVIVSPAFLRETWSTFGESLAGFHAMRGGLLVPLLISDCDLPLRLELWVRLDFRSAEHRDGELARLLELIHPAASRGTEAVELECDAEPDEAVLSLPMPSPSRPHRPERIRISRARVAVAAMVIVLGCITVLRAPRGPFQDDLADEPLDPADAEPPPVTPPVIARADVPASRAQLHRERRPVPSVQGLLLLRLMARGDVKGIREWLRQGKPYKPLIDEARVALTRRNYVRALRWCKLAADTVGDSDAAWICAQAYVAQDRWDLAEPYLLQSDAAIGDEPGDDLLEDALP
jgi:hypothetical protein